MMRFHTPLLAAALLVALTVPASGQVTFGVKAGANFATLAGDDVTDVDSRTGLVLGGLLVYDISELLAIQPELLYSQKGGSFSETLGGETVSGTLKLDYVEVPLLLRLSVPAGSPDLRPSLHAGPTFAFEVSCKVSFTAFGDSGTEDCEDDGDRRKFDPGLGLGGGLDVAFLAGTLMIEGRYTMSLRTLDASGDEADVKNRAWSLTFGYRFR
jgi:hypothetical protein